MRLFKRKRPPSKLMLKVEEIDGKVDTLIDQVSQLAAVKPASTEKPAPALEPDSEPFTEFEPFSTEEPV